MQRCRVGVGARVARNDVQLRYRYIQSGVAGIVEFEELHVAFAEVEVDEPLVAGDAMLFMDHWGADLEFGEIAQPVVDRGLALCRVACAA